MGIDPGLNNWLTCISFYPSENLESSFIVDGKQLKSVNRWYNKQVSVLKENKPQGFWSKRLARITEKRNRQIKDAVNKAASIVIRQAWNQGIETIIFGWNQGQKKRADMGSKTNPKVCSNPNSEAQRTSSDN